MKNGKKIYKTITQNGFETCFVRILKNQEIELEGIYKNHVNGPQVFKTKFKIGGLAVYDSYNLIYTGTIVGIGEKTVSIQHYSNSPRRSQLSLEKFAWRNWNFDYEKIKKHNHEESYYI